MVVLRLDGITTTPVGAGAMLGATPDAVVHRVRCGKDETDEYFQAIADRVEIEALRGEFTERVYEVRYHDTTLSPAPGIPVRCPRASGAASSFLRAGSPSSAVANVAGA